MKREFKIKCLFLLLCGMTMITACEKEENGDITLKGNTDLEENKVGTVLNSMVRLYSGNNFKTEFGKSKVIANDNGVIEVELSMETKSESLSNALNHIANYAKEFNIGDSFTSSGGKVIAKGRLFNSSEGVAIVNATGRQGVIMKYDVNVGDTWSYKSQKGTVETLKVTKKSTENDYSMGYMKIKVVQVEQIPTEPGITKIVYTGNHKFGLVEIAVHLEDGSTIKLYK
ncbi:hypothetical protein JN06_00554 [Bacteroides zoogleoformans]|uniref:Lipoprotein n=1 Tax=Bacteroides zoogleoformans TaxID=28119 RepID=A0ABM6T8H2_9BACE|nr:hypothetical protein [Bacteroides zoogleoformans]AVM53105.1 hypothetical protein C4H11_09320 [Bacteroides zoogleoformans]TWJ17979.1 hypothetical protein JN06_00554 [Bacteroides zoogleoformans]